MDTFGGKGKATRRDQESLDDLLGDLLDPEESPKKKAPQGRGRTSPVKTGGKDDFYSNLAAMADKDRDSDMSDADIGTMAKSIAGLDDMDAALFGDSLKKKGSFKGNKPTTPRSKSNTPRSATGGAVSPTRSDTTASPPGSARGSLKRKPQKPTSSSQPPPGSAPGKLSDIGRESQNLKPNQPREEQRPSTTPMVKKYNFGDFDEDDPLAGLLDDDDSISEAGRKPKKPAAKEQRSAVEEESKPAQAVAQPGSPRKVNLFDRPPTRSGNGTSESAAAEPVAPAASAPSKPDPVPASKRKEELIFSDDDNFLDGLGIEADAPKKPVAAAAPTPAAARTKSALDDDEDRPARSVLDGLLGRGQKSSAASLLETKEKPRTFVLDKKYTQPAEEKKEEEDFLFGSYAPSAAGSTGGNSRPNSRRSVRFQDDDDIFGPDKPADPPRSAGSGGRGAPDDMKWLEELTGGTGAGDSTLSSNRSAAPSVATPSSPRKTGAATGKQSSPIKKPESPRKTAGSSVGAAKDSVLEGLLKHSPRDASPERKPSSPERKPESAQAAATPAKAAIGGKDWLGLKSDSDEELFIPRRVPDRSPGIADTGPKTPTSARSRSGGAKSPANDGGVKVTDDDEEDSFIARAKARRQAAMGSQAQQSGPAVAPSGGGGRGMNGAGAGSFAANSTVDPASLLAQSDSPRFQGSVPSALQEGNQETRDLFAFPSSRNASVPKFERAADRTPAMDSFDTRMDADRFGFASSAAGIEPDSGRDFQSSLFETKNEDVRPTGRYNQFSGLSGPPTAPKDDQLQLFQQQQQQQQLLQQQQQQFLQQQQQQLLQKQLQELQQKQQSQMSALSFSQQNTSYSGNLAPSFAASQGPIPTSLQDALAQLRKVEIEKQYSDSLVESTRKRFEEEIAAIERSYKNRLQILEESNHKSEGRLRSEMERLMEEHLAKVKRMEQEKADLAAENYKRLEEQERGFAQELEKLKEKHRQVLLDVKREHEEFQQQLLESKNKEILKVAASHDTSKSLSAAVEQIENNARDLGQLQMKLDEWNRSGLDEREITMRSKDEQLKMLQARLSKQEEDNEKERHRLEDLIARMESQNRDQLRQIEEERWKLKQEQSRLEAQQTSLENERRTFSELQARERVSMERARDMFLEEQQSGLSHLTDERRNLAEERSKLNMEQKLHRERVQQDTIRTAQAQAEYEVLTKTMAEEKNRQTDRLHDLRREEERIAAERDRFHEQAAALEQEKQRLERMALNLKQRSAELDSVSDEANRARSSSDRSLAEIRMLHNQIDQRQAELEGHQAAVKQMEDHIAQEKLRLAKEKKDLDNMKQAGLCFSCNSMLHAATNQLMHKASGNMLAGIPMGGNPLAGPPAIHNHSSFNGNVQHQHQHQGNSVTYSSVTYETVASSIANDRAVRMWKIQAIKDQEYLEEESMFLEGLKHSPYHSGSKT